MKILVCQQHPELNGRKFYFSARNVSRGGMQVWADTPIPVGVYMSIALALSIGDTTYRLTGEVRWMSEVSESGIYRVGLQFLSSSRDKAAWDQWVDQLMASGASPAP